LPVHECQVLRAATALCLESALWKRKGKEEGGEDAGAINISQPVRLLGFQEISAAGRRDPARKEKKEGGTEGVRIVPWAWPFVRSPWASCHVVGKKRQVESDAAPPRAPCIPRPKKRGRKYCLVVSPRPSRLSRLLATIATKKKKKEKGGEGEGKEVSPIHTPTSSGAPGAGKKKKKGRREGKEKNHAAQADSIPFNAIARDSLKKEKKKKGKRGRGILSLPGNESSRRNHFPPLRSTSVEFQDKKKRGGGKGEKGGGLRWCFAQLYCSLLADIAAPLTLKEKKKGGKEGGEGKGL